MKKELSPSQLAIREEILQRLERGESLRAICKETWAPDESSVRQWARDDSDFAPRYARARQLGYSRMAEEIIAIADTPVEGTKTTTKQEQLLEFGRAVPNTLTEKIDVTVGDMIEHRRLQVDTRKWLLSKVLPKIYGDKAALELTGADGGPVAVVAETKVTHLDPIAASEAYQKYMQGK